MLKSNSRGEYLSKTFNIPNVPTTSGMVFTLHPGFWVARSTAKSQYFLPLSSSRSWTGCSHAHATSKMTMRLDSHTWAIRLGRRASNSLSVGMLRSTISLALGPSNTVTLFQLSSSHQRLSGTTWLNLQHITSIRWYRTRSGLSWWRVQCIGSHTDYMCPMVSSILWHTQHVFGSGLKPLYTVDRPLSVSLHPGPLQLKLQLLSGNAHLEPDMTPRGVFRLFTPLEVAIVSSCFTKSHVNPLVVQSSSCISLLDRNNLNKQSSETAH